MWKTKLVLWLCFPRAVSFGKRRDDVHKQSVVALLRSLSVRVRWVRFFIPVVSLFFPFGVFSPLECPSFFAKYPVSAELCTVVLLIVPIGQSFDDNGFGWTRFWPAG